MYILSKNGRFFITTFFLRNMKKTSIPAIGTPEVDPPLQRRQRRHLHLRRLRIRPGDPRQQGDQEQVLRP
jgi:hypothetical protein